MRRGVIFRSICISFFGPRCLIVFVIDFGPIFDICFEVCFIICASLFEGRSLHAFHFSFNFWSVEFVEMLVFPKEGDYFTEPTISGNLYFDQLFDRLLHQFCIYFSWHFIFVVRYRFLNRFFNRVWMDLGPFSHPKTVLFQGFSEDRFLEAFGPRLGSVLAPFGVHLSPFWFPWAPFGLLFVSLRLDFCSFCFSLRIWSDQRLWHVKTV